ncbi:MAG: hypothetical protein ACKVJN_13605, partial [Woeseiales bacterium]
MTASLLCSIRRMMIDGLRFNREWLIYAFHAQSPSMPRLIGTAVYWSRSNFRIQAVAEESQHVEKRNIQLRRKGGN